jgi:hypothetical protein
LRSRIHERRAFIPASLAVGNDDGSERGGDPPPEEAVGATPPLSFGRHPVSATRTSSASAADADAAAASLPPSSSEERTWRAIPSRAAYAPARRSGDEAEEADADAAPSPPPPTSPSHTARTTEEEGGDPGDEEDEEEDRARWTRVREACARIDAFAERRCLVTDGTRSGFSATTTTPPPPP